MTICEINDIAVDGCSISRQKIQCFMNLLHPKFFLHCHIHFAFLHERKVTAAISKIVRLDY